MSLLKAMTTVAGMTGLSRIAGFVRDILTAAILGAGPVADAFFVALKLPNFFRRVTAEGAFSVAFVPLYTKKLEVEGEEESAIFAGYVFSFMVTGLSVFTVLSLLAMPYILYVIAPGFTGDPVRYDLAVALTRITFPYLLLMSLSALIGGMLNAHARFAPFAAAPILFNLSLIAALLYGVPLSKMVGYAPEYAAGYSMAWGVLVAGCAQFLMLIIALWRYGVPIKIVRPVYNGDVAKILRLMGPGIIGAGVVHINLFADMIIASLLQSGSISYLYYADRLNQLPLGVVGIAIGTALLPMMSRALTGIQTGTNQTNTNPDVKEKQDANALFNRALEYCLIFALPAAVALAVIPHTLIQVLFERGAFTQDDTSATAFVLTGYALGLPAYVFVKVLSTVYWANEDTLTPVKVSVISTSINIVLSLVLVWPMGVAGIAFSTGLAGWLQFALLQRGLKTRLINGDVANLDKRFLTNAPRVLVASMIMGAVVFVLNQILAPWLNDSGQSSLASIVALCVIICCGAGIYGAILLVSGVLNKNDMDMYFRRNAGE